MKTDAERIKEELEAADANAEGANYHDRVGLARGVFKAVSKFVAPIDHVKLARKIRGALSV